MASNDLLSGFRLSQAAGWNQTPNDWQLILDQNSGNNWVAVDKNMVIGTVTSINYSNKFEWIGMMLVDSNHQRKGIGQKLMEKVIEQSSTDCLRLDATEMGKKLYDKLGFIPDGTIHRYVRSAGDQKKTRYRELPKNMHSISSENLEMVFQFDNDQIGTDRSKILTRIYRRGVGFCLKSENRVKGYVLGRSGERYFQLGPLMAKAPILARTLLQTMLYKGGGDPIIIDLINHDQQIINFLQENGFDKQRSLVRMSLSEIFQPAHHPYLFGIVDPAMG